ncbi:MAG: M24 family metallopeptidase [Ferruginibacter sp.]
MNEAKQKMLFAEQKAKELFITAEERGLIVPGKLESKLSEEIVSLAKNEFGIEKYWHKKIVRTGANTINSFSGNPPDRIIENDDILFIDLGPIVDGYEADLGRTYVMGKNLSKLQLKDDVETAWQEARDWYFHQDELTGAMYYNYLTALAKQYGWEYGGEIGGHIVGHFPHEQPDDPNDLGLDIHPDNHASILLLDKQGNKRNWILEIQFVDRAKNIGGFFEQLLM